MEASPVRVPRLAVLSLALVWLACSDSSGPPRVGPPATLTVVTGTPQAGASGEPLAVPLSVKVADRDARPVPNAVVSFAVTTGGGTLSAPIDSTDAQGVAAVVWTMGPLLGNARVEARVTGVLAPAVFTATVQAGPPSAVVRVSPQVGNSAGGFDVPDSVAVKVVDRFDHPIANAQVAFAVTGGGGAISHATRTTGTDGIARTAWTLGPSGAQTLRALAGSFETTIAATAVTCVDAQLALGQILAFVPGSPTCATIGGAAQKYLVSVVNTSSLASSAIGFRFRGAGAAAASLTTSSPVATATARSAAYAADALQERTEAHVHADLMKANAALLDRMGPARRVQQRTAARSLVQAASVPTLGEVLPVRIPLNFSALCDTTSSPRVGGRVVYVGEHAVILEDTLAPFRGQHDAVYQAVGEEFDNVMWPILTTNYGNPLALDAQLDNNGRLFMVFSPRINSVAGGTIAGFVTSGDFFPAQLCPATNNGEYFYARVPTSANTGFDSDNTTVTADEWLRATRTVIIHEVKHITSYAHKLPAVTTGSFFSRDAWLEEATAMVAEELWARAVFGYGFGGNVEYAASIFCEVRPRDAACAGKPVAMFDHFYWLAEFAGGTETRSPVADPSDPSVYGSGWLFVRWLLDQYATSEADVLKATTSEATLPGVESVEARVARTFGELINDWALAFVLDDYPDVTTATPHAIKSWDLRDIYRGLNVDFSPQGFFLQPFPLKVRTTGFGKFLFDVSAVRGGSMSMTEVSGAQAAKQLFEFKGLSGTEFPAEMRISIVRVQ